MSLLDQTARRDGGRIVAALAAAFRDLDLAEEAYAEACARAAAVWPAAPPLDPAAWLYAVARRYALDMIRRRNMRRANALEPPAPPPTAAGLPAYAGTAQAFAFAIARTAWVTRSSARASSWRTRSRLMP